jgi:hypothetical protein
MKKYICAIVFLVAWPLHAQPIQKAHCAGSSCSLPSQATLGDTIVIVEKYGLSVSDGQGDFFNLVYAKDWGGVFSSLWYSLSAIGGPVTVQSPNATYIYVAEYPPMTIDVVSQQVFLCCQSSVTIPPITVSNENETLIEWTSFGPPASIPASPGFTVEDSGGVMEVEDEVVPPGSYGMTLKQAPLSPYGARMAAFRPLSSRFAEFKAPYAPIQVKLCQPKIGSCSFDKPVTEGDMLNVVGIGSCAVGIGCNSISDSLGNTWKVAMAVQNNYGMALTYALDIRGGQDTIYFAPNTNWFDIIAEYAPSLGLDDVNYGTYSDAIFHMPNGDNSNWDVTRAVLTTQPCDLLVSWGTPENAGSDARPGPGFTVRAYYEPPSPGSIALEDATTGVPGPYIGSIFWTGLGHWDLGVAAFKMNGCKTRIASPVVAMSSFQQVEPSGVKEGLPH